MAMAMLIVNIVIAVALLLTFGAAIYYAIETKKLRKASISHNEILLRPFLWLHYKGNSDFWIENMGNGIACNVAMETITVVASGKRIEYRFEEIDIIPPGRERPAKLRIFSDDRQVEDSDGLHLLSAVLTHECDEAFVFETKITCESTARRQYWFRHKTGAGGTGLLDHGVGHDP